MELTNYWLLVIWIFLGGAILAMFHPQKEEVVLGEKTTQWNMIYAIILMLPYIVWAGFRGNFVDTNAYRRMFFNAPSSLNQISNYIAENPNDKGFSVLLILLKSVVGNSDTLFFLIIALFQGICLIYVFRKYSSNYWVSIFLFIISCSYISWMFNGMRQFIAVCICFLGTELILKKKYVPLIVLILLASTMHGTAIIMLPLVLISQGKAWNNKTVILIILTLLAVISVDRFTNLLDIITTGTQYEGIMESEVVTGDDGTNPIRVLVFSVPAIISYIGRKKIRKEDDIVINFCTNMSIITAAIYAISMVTSGILLGRLPIYTLLYSYILLPWEIENIFECKKLRRLIYFSMIVLYFGFFYYQMHFAHGLI